MDPQDPQDLQGQLEQTLLFKDQLALLEKQDHKDPLALLVQTLLCRGLQVLRVQLGPLGRLAIKAYKGCRVLLEQRGILGL